MKRFGYSQRGLSQPETPRLNYHSVSVSREMAIIVTEHMASGPSDLSELTELTLW